MTPCAARGVQMLVQRALELGTRVEIGSIVMAQRTDGTPPQGVIGTTTLNKNRFTINCATCGKKQTVRASDRTEAWAAFRQAGWIAYADKSSPRPTHAACAECSAVVSE